MFFQHVKVDHFYFVAVDALVFSEAAEAGSLACQLAHEVINLLQ